MLLPLPALDLLPLVVRRGGVAANMAKAKPEKTNKSAYIRKHPSLSAGDLVAQAKKDGLEINAGLVYAIRSADKQKKSGAKVGKTSKPANPVFTPGLEYVIRELVREELKALLSKL